MKRIITCVLLFCHVNFSMFLPPAEELNLSDSNGLRKDDIGSVFEYINEIVLGNSDDGGQEDDDAQNLKLADKDDYSFHNSFNQVVRAFEIAVTRKTATHQSSGVLPGCTENQTPPPRSC